MQGQGLFSGGSGAGNLFPAMFAPAPAGGCDGGLFSSSSIGAGGGGGLFSQSSTGESGGGGLFSFSSGGQGASQPAGSLFIPDLEADEEEEAPTGEEEAAGSADDGEKASGGMESGESTSDAVEDEEDNEDSSTEQGESEEEGEVTEVVADEPERPPPPQLPVQRPAQKRPSERLTGADSANDGDAGDAGDLRQRIKMGRTTEQPPVGRQLLAAIVLRNVPEHLFAEGQLRDLFSGVTKVYVNRAKLQAILHFDSEDAADAAMTASAGARMRARYPGMEAFKRRADPSPATSAPTAAPSSQPTVSSAPQSNNLAERIRVLESAERQLRSRIGKASASAQAAATCQDMCPEKERYLREDRHRVHLFESAPGRPGVMDPARAVKEYSRSAADQEAPLPHELRPLPVLQRTLLYLAAEIADIGEREGRWQEWYEFLWDRTRAVRKEVTQQRLCSRGAAELVEQCARFHVYAAARMVAMPADVFDEKINNENLTKCLQTLRELYHDLPGRCPNESEFRAYMILMKLNDPSVLDEVHQLSAEVRASPAVQLALRAFFALGGSNYVAFFRVVRRSEFLAACLLLRYFTQARIAALRIMSYALTPSAGRNVSIPLAQLPLEFESETDAAEFCRFMGFWCQDGPGGSVSLDRGVASAFDPDGSRAVRAIRIIESKRGARSVGECLWGGRLPELSLPPLTVSFDERGRYVGELAAFAPSSRESTPPPPQSVTSMVRPQLQQTAPQLQAKPSPWASDIKLLASLVDGILTESLNPLVREVADSVLLGARALSGAVTDAYAIVFNAATREFCAELSTEILAEARIQHGAAADVIESLVGDVVDEGVRRLCETALDRRLVESLDIVLLNALVFEEVELSCRRFIADWSMRKSLDLELLRRHRLRRLAACWDAWRRLAAGKAESRARLTDMAPCAPLADPFQLVDRLFGRQPPDTSVARLPRCSADPLPAASAALAAAAAVARPVCLPHGCRLALLVAPDCPAVVADWLRRKLAPSLTPDGSPETATHCVAEASDLTSDARLALLHLPTLVFSWRPGAPPASLRLLGGRPTPIWHRDLLLGLRWLLDQPALPSAAAAAAPFAGVTIGVLLESILADAFYRPLADLACRCDTAGRPHPPLDCLVRFYNACIVAAAPLAAGVGELRLPDAPPLPLTSSRWRLPQEAVAWLLGAYPLARAPAIVGFVSSAAAAAHTGRSVHLLFPWAGVTARLADLRMTACLARSDAEGTCWARAPAPADWAEADAASRRRRLPGLGRLDIADFLPSDWWLWSQEAAAASVRVWQPPPPPLAKSSPAASEVALALEKLRGQLLAAQEESRLTDRLLCDVFNGTV